MRSDNDLCQPCGECRWCFGNWAAKDEVKKLRAALRRLDRKAIAILKADDPAKAVDDLRRSIRRSLPTPRTSAKAPCSECGSTKVRGTYGGHKHGCSKSLIPRATSGPAGGGT